MTKIRRTRGEQEERTSRTVSRLSLERLADRETGMICKGTRSPMQDCRNCLIALNTLIASCQLSVIGPAPSRLYHGVDGLENRVAQSCRLFIAIFATNFRRSPKVLLSSKKTINARERELPAIDSNDIGLDVYRFIRICSEYFSLFVLGRATSHEKTSDSGSYTTSSVDLFDRCSF